MNCRTALNLVERITDGSLRETDGAEWQAHLSVCEKCRDLQQRDENLTSTLSLLAEIPDAPPDLHSRVVVALKSDDRWRAVAHRVNRRRLARLVLAGCAATVLALVGVICFHAGVKSTRLERVLVQQPPQQRDRQAPAEVKKPRPERTAVAAQNSPEKYHPQEIRPIRRPRTPTQAHPWQPEWMATVGSVTGSLSKQDDHNHWLPAMRGTVVRAGELVKTGSSSKARLVLHDASEVVLESDAVLQVRRDSLALFTGKLYASVRPQRRVFVILTPAASVQVLGTRFSVAIQRRRRLLVAVFEGTVRLSNASGAVKVRAGEKAVAEVGFLPAMLSPMKPPTAIEIHAEGASPGSIFDASEGSPTFNVQIDYNNAPFQPLTLRGEVTNDRGDRVAEVQEPIATEQFRHTRRPVKVPVVEPGKYQVRFWIEAKGGIAETTVTFTVQDRNKAAPRS